MGHVLGKITASGRSPRGPDAKHRLRVERRLLEQGAAIEFELPRNLTCAACDGGGCDACERSGAVSVRVRGEPAELVQVTLPVRDSTAEGEPERIVLRIPEQGGLPPKDSPLPRGMLLLSVTGSDQTDAGVRIVPPAHVSTGIEPVVRPAPRAGLALLILVALCLALLLVLRVLRLI